MAKTKARTKAQKRGRPRKDGPREPNGRLSRARVEPIDKLALEVRARHMGITAGAAKDQRAGSYIGYLAMLGRVDGLSGPQYEGAEQFLKLRNAFLRATRAPGAIYDPEAIGGLGEGDDGYEHWCKGVIAEYSEVRSQIQEAQNSERENLWAALDLVILRNERMPHLIGATRILCNVLARHFKIT